MTSPTQTTVPATVPSKTVTKELPNNTTSNPVTRLGTPIKLVSNYHRANSVPALDLSKKISALEAIKNLRASKS